MFKSFFRRAKVFYRINPTFDSCPSCKASDSIKRSHSRGFWEKLVGRITFHKYYRCKECGWRGSLTTIKITSSSILIMFLYLLMIVGAAFITHQILKRLL